MSTILDALRKAQTSTDEESANGPEPLARGATSSPPVSASFADDLPTFDDPLPGRVAPAKGPSALLAVVVAAGGLVLGVGAASLFTGAPLPLPFGSGNDGRDATIERVATAPRAEPAADSKRSTADREARNAGAVAPQESDTRARRDRRRAAAGDEPSAAPAPTASTDGAADVIAPVAPTAGDPAAAPPAPEAPDGAARELAVAPTMPSQTAPEVLARLPEGVPDALRTPGTEGSVSPAPGTAPAAAPSMPAPSAPAAQGVTAPLAETAPPAAMPAPGGAPPAAATPQPGVPGQLARAVPPAAPALPGASPPAVAGSVPAPPPGILEAVPAGAPEVSLLFIKWSSSIDRRVASLRGPGGKLMLVREGDIIEGMRVGAIRPDAIELQWRGTSFLLLAAR